MYFPRNGHQEHIEEQQQPAEQVPKITPIQPPVKPPGSKHDVYYDGNKKNQLNELKAYFRKVLSNDSMSTYRKDIIKKIMQYTTSGIDTSRLYPEMVLASATKDIVQKKLIFHYLNIYSHHNPDFARMAVNTFMKDSNSPDLCVRAIALRHLSDLRFKGRQQYVIPVLKRGLKDYSSGAKKACLMGLTKVITQQNRLKQEPIRDEELLNTLYQMIRDNDSNVIICTLQAINQIQPQGIAMSKKLTHYLMKNIQCFSQFQLISVLNYVQLYDPRSEEQVNQLMSLLQAKIHSQNLALVLAISKIYLKYAQMFPEFMQPVLLRVKPCLLAFINNQLPETEYLALKHVLYLIKLTQCSIYVKQLNKFYLQDNNPTYLKKIKLQLMALNCRKSNFADVINQFTEYLRDPTIIQQTMSAMNYIILYKAELNQCKVIIKTLSDIIINGDSCYQNICDYSILIIQTFLRKYPKEFPLIGEVFYPLVRGIKSKRSRCAMIQVIGDYGQHIEDAVQLIVWTQSENGGIQDQLKISLLRSNIKLFFKRPIQMLNIVNNLFRAIINDEQTRLPIRDYAAMLYRAMKMDMQNFKKTFLAERNFEHQKQNFKKMEEYEVKKLSKIQFNTLQTIYQRPKEEWLIDRTKYIELLDQIEYAEEEGSTQIMKELDEITIMERNRSKVQFSSEYHKLEADDIESEFQMSAEQFQRYWEQFEVGSSMTRIIKNPEMLNEETLEQLFRLWKISIIASAEDQETVKQFLYLKLNDRKDFACMEFQVMKEVETMTLVVKCENEELGGFVAKYIQDFLKLNELI